MATRERVRSELTSPTYDDGTTEQAISERWLGYYTELHRASRPPAS